MRTASLLLCALLLTATARATPSEQALSQREQESALLHRRLDLSDLKRWDRRTGRWTPLDLSGPRLLVVNLWSVACAPCLAEFPVLRRMAQQWHTSPHVRFAFISESEDPDKAAAYWRKAGAQVPDEDPLQVTNQRLRAALDCDTQPLTLILDDKHVVRQAFIGSILERRIEMAAAMERLLKVLAADAPDPRRRR